MTGPGAFYSVLPSERHCAFIWCQEEEPLVSKSEVIFRDVMTHLISHQGSFVNGVVEHPKSGPRVEDVLGDRPGCGSHVVFHVPIRDIRVGRDL